MKEKNYRSKIIIQSKRMEDYNSKQPNDWRNGNKSCKE